MRKYVFLFVSITFLLFSCKNNENYSFENNIIPKPLNLEINDGFVEFGNKVFLVLNDDSQDALRLKNYISDYLSPCNISIVSEEQKGGVNLVLTLIEAQSKEGYHLTIEDNKIEISSLTYNGLFLGFQTLRQLLPPELEAGNAPELIRLPHIKIYDEPRFKYRGMHLDVCRHFFTVEEVKSYVDLLVMHKFNVFHWHLTDDQGWRIEIKAYPELTRVGSQRSGTLIKKNWGEYDDIPYGGYYTQDEIKEVVKYAEDRFITVIPEIEMPGHALAGLTAYPELGCTGGPYEVSKTWGVFDDVFCAGNEKVFEFLEAVIDEVIELFPNSPYIHIGGDECPKTMWKTCPKCQLRMKEEGLADEHELQSYFVQRMEKYINAKGKQIIGWDEILEGGLAPNATVMSWRGEEGGIAAAKSGHNAIMTPGGYCYFDHYQSEDTDSEPFAIGGFTNCEKIYGWNPIPDSLNNDEAKHILGVQANVWTEYILDLPHVQYMVLPRMATLSEVAWSKQRDAEYSTFKKRLQTMFVRYKNAGYNYAKHEVE
ncbi:MAG: beta-N-acetylhexosaminidase [Bacteroidales bacterium]|nr:beta-N-acetylhexosaminidase [Bacteroidales bacterium]MDD2387308.1 beta-N-acetylhexosaminidase [Bacteroidales bacterium]MDD4217969.1 beta-N-acetylhexosaminidase [Bacteroidales bacterium]MDY0143242.1 beta-N-acetylhexosaminidase [Bacteroidales bacterium]